MKINKIALSLIVIAFMVLSLLPQIQAMSYENHDKIFKRSLATFAVAKGLNGVISALQGTEVGASFVANVTFSVGEILDPLNDMVERFSWVMLASSVALGVEKLLIEFSGAYGLKIVFLSFGALFLATLWLKKVGFAKEWMGKIFFILVLIRFIMPFAEYSNGLIFHHYTEPMYTEAKDSLKKAKSELESISIKNSPKELSFFENLKEKFEDTSNDMLSLMIIFIFQTIIFPLFILWMCYKSIGAIVVKKFNI